MLEFNGNEALADYENEANAGRTRWQSHLLPGRCFPIPVSDSTKPVTTSPVLEELLKTQTEDTDRTLSSVSATGVIGSLSTETRNELREKNIDYCNLHFPGHVVRSELNIVLERLGSADLVGKFEALKSSAQRQVTESFKRNVLDGFADESKVDKVSADRRYPENRYWLSYLADAATDSSTPAQLAVDFFPSPNEYMPCSTHHGYKKRRKYDAVLRPVAAECSTILNVLLNVEYTATDPPQVDYNPLVGRSSNGKAKLQQSITNANDLMTFQPTRLFIPTFSFFGKQTTAKLFLSILSHDRLEFAVLDECFSTANLPAVAALLHLFRTCSLYQVGYNPLFTYSFFSSFPHYAAGDVVPVSVSIPGFPQPIILDGKRLSRVRPTPFGRSTLVLAGELVDDVERKHVVVKLSFISEHRQWRERVVVDALHAHAHASPPLYAPPLLASFAAVGSPAPDTLGTGRRNTNAPRGFTARHLEVMVFQSRHDGLKLEDLDPEQLLDAAEQLFKAILDAFRRKILHRDISINNILFAPPQLILIDWELGRQFTEAAEGTFIGTRDTMSVAGLYGLRPLPHDDIESAVYVLLKVITQGFDPPPNLAADWAKQLASFRWDMLTKPEDLAVNRNAMWFQGTYRVQQVLKYFRNNGEEPFARLLEGLLSLPLPAKRWEDDEDRKGLNPADYHAILQDLGCLVHDAVNVVRSVRTPGYRSRSRDQEGQRGASVNRDPHWDARSGRERGGGRGSGGEVRRRRSRSRSPGWERERGSNNLHVSGLSHAVDTRDLEAAFAKVGRVKKASVMYDPHTRESRGFGFVTMESPDEAEAAVVQLTGMQIRGRVIAVQKARRGRARTPTPGRYHGPPKRGDDQRPYHSRSYDSRYSREYGGRYDDYRGGHDDYRGGRRGRDDYRDDHGGGGRSYDNRHRADHGGGRGGYDERRY